MRAAEGSLVRASARFRSTESWAAVAVEHWLPLIANGDQPEHRKGASDRHADQLQQFNVTTEVQIVRNVGLRFRDRRDKSRDFGTHYLAQKGITRL